MSIQAAAHDSRTEPTADPGAGDTITRRGPSAHLSGRRGLVAAVVAVPIVVMILMTAFGWAAAELAPRHLPIGITGPAELTTQVSQAQTDELGALDVTTYADRTDAESAIRDRVIYGALAVGSDGPVVLTASGSSPLVAQMLTQMATSLSPGTPPQVVDVVPGDPDDPRGAGFAAIALPLVLGGLALGAITSFVVVGRREQLIAVVGGALVCGVAAIAIIQGWLGLIGGSWVTNTGVIALIVLAAAAVLVGLANIAGRVGFAVGVLALMLVGNPFSALSSAPEMLPEPWGAIGQSMPIGAGGWLLRSTAFFDGRGIGAALWVLVIWAVVGLTLIVLPQRSGRLPATG